MTSYFHIVMGDSAKGSLRAYFEEHKDALYYGCIKNFREDLSSGSIYQLEQNIDKRAQWFKELNNATGYSEWMKDEDIVRDIEEIYSMELDIPLDARIIIWHGKNIIEQVSLRYLVNKFKNNELHEVDVSKSINKEFNNERYSVRATAECRPEDLGKALEKIELIDEQRREMLIQEWILLEENTSALRILQNEKISNVHEDYYDASILKNTPYEFVKAARVVGKVMGMSEQVVGDTFIDYRLRKLIESGKLEYRGTLGFMREFEIKLK